MKIVKSLILLIVFFLSFEGESQETLPIYSDYLSDNVYLVHPSAAGIGNTGKLRFTARQQWAGVKDAPTLQTISYHNRFREKAALGFILFNDSNGFHSQKGIQGTFAYHLDLNRASVFNQLSFGLSLTAVQNQVDQTQFFGDPTIAQIIRSDGYFNADFSVAYHRKGFSSYLTVKNLLLSAKNNLNNNLEPLDLRNYILSLGYYFGDKQSFQFEPSLMIQLRESTGERIVDFNFKAYKDFNKAQLWGALSYRKGFDAKPIEDLVYITPIIGVNYNKWMFSYTYTRQMNDIVLTDLGFHQVSIGVNLFTRKPRAAACPNINASF
ncbi:type IX secretion system membrane protein PorP/SprF [Flavobacteriaceae bacterium]|jgi:type IX secretion system PorP/SprF family membrane protein|nr:type IX secretion system membrane protein PorP/SprF [Flavobacteriaceae bacterium]MDB2685318.1 type IX secretion system membrane protein PorP/SprF [Flavobacteriaceae bacterium]MDC3345018.1 type IX secretion system membrane protein PorP/SprF [Flavobacteriaceae bacterium]